MDVPFMPDKQFDAATFATNTRGAREGEIGDSIGRLTMPGNSAAIGGARSHVRHRVA